MIADPWDRAAKSSLASGKRKLTTSGIQKWCRDLFKVHRHESWGSVSSEKHFWIKRQNVDVSGNAVSDSLDPSHLFKYGHISKWLNLGGNVYSFFPHCTKSAPFSEKSVFCLSVVFSLISKSDNKVLISKWIDPTFPKQKWIISCCLAVVSHDLPLFPPMDRVTVDGWTDRSGLYHCGSWWSFLLLKLVFFICIIARQLYWSISGRFMEGLKF